MINEGIILLIILVIVSVIVLLSLLIWGGIAYTDNKGKTGGTVLLPPCSQNVNISSLLQIPENGYNCVRAGITGSLYYIGNLGDKTYDYVVAPYTTAPFTVCVSFCSNYSQGVCTGPSSSGKSAQENFNNCMSQLSSTECTPPIPIAVKGTTLYYAYLPTCKYCDGCATLQKT